MTIFFKDFSLDSAVLSALDEIGYESPSIIQKEAIPIILEGRDLIALAETGSGKTAACAIPCCHKINPDNRGIQALVLVPTRELALQYVNEIHRIGRKKQVMSFGIYGGEDFDIQRAKLSSGVHILVATPGRLIDFIYSRQIDLSHVETLVLDEADEMLSLGFYEDMLFIMDCLVHEHQTLLFSATMPASIHKLASVHLKDPAIVKPPIETSTPKAIDHIFVSCPAHAKEERLLEVLKEYKPSQTIIFCESRIQCEKLHRFLRQHIPQCDYLHGGLTQQMRSSITHKFRNQKIRTMVATDIAARGLDFSGVTHVIVFQLGRDSDQYIHRSGRCGRCGREGVAITLVTVRDMPVIEKVLKKLDREIKWIGEPPISKKRDSYRRRQVPRPKR